MLFIEFPQGKVQSAKIKYRDVNRDNKIVTEVKKYVHPFDVDVLGVWESDNCNAAVLEKIPFANVISIEWLGVPGE